MATVLVMVVGYDDDEEQAFWDVIPVQDPQAEKGESHIDAAKRLASERFDRLRGDYASVVDVLTIEEMAGMLDRINMENVSSHEAAYRMLEAEAEDRPDLDQLLQEWNQLHKTRDLGETETGEGWLLSDSDTRGMEIERDDTRARFIDDNAAMAYVMAKAETGDELCQVALGIHYLDQMEGCECGEAYGTRRAGQPKCDYCRFGAGRKED